MEDTLNSILTSIKNLLGLNEECVSFDVSILMYINDAISTLTELGIGPTDGFTVLTKDDTFKDYLGENAKDKLINKVRMYIFHKVKLKFDPGTNSIVIDCLKEMIKEEEWRLIEINEDKDEKSISWPDAVLEYDGS